MPATAIYLHVGLKKTGTSYLQGVAWASREALAAQGLALVPDSQRGMFDVMLDVRDSYDPEADPERVRHALARLPEQVDAAGADRALLSEESLSMATPEQVARVLAALAGREVHLVLTVRDLARQVPSAWQQSVQARGSIPFERYVAAVVRGRGRGSAKFRSSQDVLDVLDRWAVDLPPERVHLVTVPQRGAAPTELADRFFGLLGADPARLVTDVDTFNVSLGRVQAELLARVNARLPESARRRDRYGDVGKRYFAQRILGPQGGEPARMPRQWQDWCLTRSEEVVAELGARGYDVVGDLADLLPVPESFGEVEPGPPDAALLEVAEQALAALLVDRVAETDERRERRRVRLDAAAAGSGTRPRPTGGVARLLARLRGTQGRA